MLEMESAVNDGLLLVYLNYLIHSHESLNGIGKSQARYWTASKIV